MHMIMIISSIQAIIMFIVFSILIVVVTILVISLVIMSIMIMPGVMIVFFERASAVAMMLLFYIFNLISKWIN